MDVTYHSHHGAVQESLHVFMEAGWDEALRTFSEGTLKVLEMGFGTGLNALLTMQATIAADREVQYTALEKFPLSIEMATQLKYGDDAQAQHTFGDIHRAGWGRSIGLSPSFSLCKKATALEDFTSNDRYHLFFFDAFSPTAQPELWTEEIFRKLYDMAQQGAVLVTYCSKSIVRKAMAAAGWQVTKIPGPRGKREMVRAYRR